MSKTSRKSLMFLMCAVLMLGAFWAGATTAATHVHADEPKVMFVDFNSKDTNHVDSAAINNTGTVFAGTKSNGTRGDFELFKMNSGTGTTDIMLQEIDTATVKRTRLQVGGNSGASQITAGGGFSQRIISFNVDAASSLQIWYAATGASATTAVVFMGDYTQAGNTRVFTGEERVNVTSLAPDVVELENAGSYFIAFTANTNVFYISVTEVGEVDPNACIWGEYQVITAPTCTEKGLERAYCTKHNAGEELTDENEYKEREISALGHAWSEWEEVTPATETTKGEQSRECSRCHEEETRDIPVLDSSCRTTLDMQFVTLGATFANATVELGKGFTSVGGGNTNILNDDSISTEGAGRKMMGAAADGGDIFYPSVLTRYKSGGASTGLSTAAFENVLPTARMITFEKETAGDSKLSIWALGGGSANTGRRIGIYNISEGAVNPFIGSEVVLGSSEEITPVTFTLTEEGTYSIAFIDNAINVYYILLEGHTYGDWTETAAATCQEDGSKERVCSECGHKETVVIEHLSETPCVWGEWTVTKEATCTEEGSRSRECEVCHDVEVQAIVKEAHTHTVTVKSGSETLTTYNKAINCGAKFTRPLADPTKEGYTFAGWYSDAALTTEFDFNTVIREDITVYAKFTQNAPVGGGEEPKGCGGSIGSIGLYGFAAVAMLAACVVLIKRKKEQF